MTPKEDLIKKDRVGKSIGLASRGLLFQTGNGRVTFLLCPECFFEKDSEAPFKLSRKESDKIG